MPSDASRSPRISRRCAPSSRANTRAPEVIASDDVRERLKTLTEVTDIAPPVGLKARLRPYQARGYAWLMKNLTLGIGALIADDMGLGKTLQVIARHHGAQGKGRASTPKRARRSRLCQRPFSRTGCARSPGFRRGSRWVFITAPGAASPSERRCPTSRSPPTAHCGATPKFSAPAAGGFWCSMRRRPSRTPPPIKALPCARFMPRR